MIPNVTARRKRFVSVKIPLNSSKSLSENPEILNEHKTVLFIYLHVYVIFAFSRVIYRSHETMYFRWKACSKVILYWKGLIQGYDRYDKAPGNGLLVQSFIS